MDSSKALLITDWEILHKKPDEHHEFFLAEQCTQNQAWTLFEKIPRQDRGRILHIREQGSYTFTTYDDKEA
tara:strand:+ start:318 stop:530 length:213 start_codon:yes stop_codon:yes gene_type:complete